MRFLATKSLLVAAALSLAIPAAAKNPNPTDLMRKSDKQHRIKEEHTKIEMLLEKKGGPKRVRVTETYVYQDPADKGDKGWIRFDAPGDVKGTTLLTHEKKGGDDNQWLYLPAFKKTRRVASSELGDRFAGTDLFYEDLQRRVVDDYGYKLKGSEKFQGHDCWVIEAVPTAARVKETSPYSKSLIWLRKDIHFPIKLQHFDKAGKPLKQLISGKLVKVHGDAWRPDSLEAIDVQRNHRTLMRTKSRQVNQGIPDSVFRPESFFK